MAKAVAMAIAASVALAALPPSCFKISYPIALANVCGVATQAN